MMLTKESGHTGSMRVLFSLPCFHAESIHVVGDFNAWTPGATPLRPCEYGWCAVLELPVGCAYRYRYLVNGSRWLNDWHADRYVPNTHGGDDSVVITLLPHEMEGVEIICPYDGRPCPYTLHRVPNDDRTGTEDSTQTVCTRKTRN